MGSHCETVYVSVNEEWRDVENVEFSDHLVALNRVKSRNKIKWSLMKLPGDSR